MPLNFRTPPPPKCEMLPSSLDLDDKEHWLEYSLASGNECCAVAMSYGATVRVRVPWVPEPQKNE